MVLHRPIESTRPNRTSTRAQMFHSGVLELASLLHSSRAFRPRKNCCLFSLAGRAKPRNEKFQFQTLTGPAACGYCLVANQSLQFLRLSRSAFMKLLRSVLPSRTLGGILMLLLMVFAVPQMVNASPTSWTVSLGAQSADAASQAMAYLPNEIWIDAGDSVTWMSNTGEAHTVSFLLQPEAPAVAGSFPSTAVTRPNFQFTGPGSLFGCAGGNQGGPAPHPQKYLGCRQVPQVRSITRARLAHNARIAA